MTRTWTDDDVAAARRGRELVDLAEAMALVGETDAAAFWTNVQLKRYPGPATRVRKGGLDGRGKVKWLPFQRWRRGALELALVRLQERKIKGL